MKGQQRKAAAALKPWLDSGLLDAVVDAELVASEWMHFKAALESADIERLRRCPVCKKIYYAVRKNKGACDPHLNVARVRRHRNRTEARSNG